MNEPPLHCSEIGQRVIPPELNGFAAVVKSERSLWWAVDQLVESLGTDELRRLNVRAGEHLAAIITTCFLGFPPNGIDTSGGVDLDFSRSWREVGALASWLPEAPAVFEVKSLPGPFREVDSAIDRAIARGGDPKGMGVKVTVKHAADILIEAAPTISKIGDQLAKKADIPSVSGHGFLIVHLFDHIPVEIFEPVLAPHLAPPPDSESIESMWVLWWPTFITLWSKKMHAWLNLMFAAEDDTTGDLHVNLDVLQDAESYFHRVIGNSEPSPFIFSFNGGKRQR